MKRIIMLVSSIMILLTSTAFATKGYVAYFDEESQIIAIQTQQGYTCGNIMAIVPFGKINQGDLIGGNMFSYASQNLYDINTDYQFNMWIEEYWLSSDDAIAWIQNH
jgi:hypothetical protein